MSSESHQEVVTGGYVTLPPLILSSSCCNSGACTCQTVFGPDKNQLLSDVLNTYAHRSIAREGVSGVEPLRHWQSILGRPCFTWSPAAAFAFHPIVSSCALWLSPIILRLPTPHRVYVWKCAFQLRQCENIFSLCSSLDSSPSWKRQAAVFPAHRFVHAPLRHARHHRSPQIGCLASICAWLSRLGCWRQIWFPYKGVPTPSWFWRLTWAHWRKLSGWLSRKLCT